VKVNKGSKKKRAQDEEAPEVKAKKKSLKEKAQEEQEEEEHEGWEEEEPQEEAEEEQEGGEEEHGEEEDPEEDLEEEEEEDEEDYEGEEEEDPEGEEEEEDVEGEEEEEEKEQEVKEEEEGTEGNQGNGPGADQEQLVLPTDGSPKRKGPQAKITFTQQDGKVVVKSSDEVWTLSSQEEIKTLPHPIRMALYKQMGRAVPGGEAKSQLQTTGKKPRQSGCGASSVTRTSLPKGSST
jgi:hypothetical protein